MCSHLFVYQAPLGTSAGSYWGFDLSCDRTASWDVVCSHDVSCDVFQSELDPSFKAFNSVRCLTHAIRVCASGGSSSSMTVATSAIVMDAPPFTRSWVIGRSPIAGMSNSFNSSLLRVHISLSTIKQFNFLNQMKQFTPGRGKGAIVRSSSGDTSGTTEEACAVGSGHRVR